MGAYISAQIAETLTTIGFLLPLVAPVFKAAIAASKKFHPATDIPSLKGKVILVTGGNAGLGKQSIAYLAAASPTRIYLAARTASKASAAIADLKAASLDAEIEYLPLDLTSFASIRDAAQTFRRREPRLDVLMNNAGVMATPYSRTDEGYEIQFGTNHMGHALLTKLLLPTLLHTAAQPGADVRIVNLSSMAHMFAPAQGLVFDQAALEHQATWRRYGQSKLANILFARELAARYPAITSVSIHPGVIVTDLYASLQMNLFLRFLLRIYRLLTPFLPGHFGDARGGALNQAWAAVAPKGDLQNGGFYMPVGELAAGSKLSADVGLQKRLWEYTEMELAKHGY